VNLGEGLSQIAAEAVRTRFCAARRMTGQAGQEQRRNIAVRSCRVRRDDLGAGMRVGRRNSSTPASRSTV
jgi:hypothetical protein